MEKSKEVCTILLMFNVQSDNEALAVKSKLSEVMKDMKNVKMDFRISTDAMPKPFKRP